MLLERIVNDKKKEIERSKKLLAQSTLMGKIAKAPPPRGFKPGLERNRQIAVIAEIKQASPSKGVFCKNFNPKYLAGAYAAGGASAISVITEQRYFKGSLEYIPLVKEATALPLLRKDFIVDQYQVYESRAAGADAVLLIAALLDHKSLFQLQRLALSLEMDVLVEVHDHAELVRAVEIGASIIGINNRDLKTFQTTLERTFALAKDMPAETLLVSESGIANREDILKLENIGVRAVLIGEILVRSKDPCRKIKELRGIGFGEEVKENVD
ncbi:MAG: indole-3-glycerol phosphate synthase TrpC [Bacillota bacterium]